MFKLSSATTYLGRKTFLFNLADVYKVAVDAAKEVGVRPPPKDQFLIFNATRLVAITNNAPIAKVSYHYQEESDLHFTNFSGLMYMCSLCPPNMRSTFMEGILPVIETESELDLNRRQLAVDYIKLKGNGLLSECVVLSIEATPDEKVSILEKYRTASNVLFPVVVKSNEDLKNKPRLVTDEGDNHVVEKA